jgi:dipeptidyl aminopeptidase/acylaminoacyl peptidase
LLILHGAQDTNIPVVNAEQLIKLCGLKQLTCENHIYPDQEHGFTGKSLEDADNRTIDFFARKLK